LSQFLLSRIVLVRYGGQSVEELSSDIAILSECEAGYFELLAARSRAAARKHQAEIDDGLADVCSYWSVVQEAGDLLSTVIEEQTCWSSKATRSVNFLRLRHLREALCAGADKGRPWQPHLPFGMDGLAVLHMMRAA